MIENIVLTKIAKNTSKYQKDYDKIRSFQYEGNEWVFLDGFKEDENIILEFIKTCKFQSTHYLIFYITILKFKV